MPQETTEQSSIINEQPQQYVIKIDMKANKKKLRLNSLIGLLYQVVALVCGLILPRLILNHFGSNVNGLVNSIVSFLSFVTLLELGVGAVIQSSLYKPLAENNHQKISSIYNAGKKYFNTVGTLFISIILIVAIVFPFFVQDDFDYIFTFILVLSISLSMLAEYFFGAVNALLIKADQKIYLTYIVQIITAVLNVIVCSILIQFNASIQMVKLAASLVFMISPVFCFIYVKKHYQIDRKVKFVNELPQKWDGLAQHIAAFVLSNTDIVVLTIFATLLDVSIYAVYYMVAKNLKNIVNSITGGFQSFYGNIYASNDQNKLKQTYNRLSTLSVNLTTICFSVAIVTIVPFVLLYTKGDKDGVDYNQLTFGVLLLISQLINCIRTSQLHLVLAANHFRQTKRSAIVEAIINVVVSVILVNCLGLVGVAIGTIVAMLYRVIALTIYLTKHLVKESIGFYVKQFGICFVVVTVAVITASSLRMPINNWGVWIIFAGVSGVLVLVLDVVLNCIFNRDMLKYYVTKLRRKK